MPPPTMATRRVGFEEVEVIIGWEVFKSIKSSKTLKTSLSVPPNGDCVKLHNLLFHRISILKIE
jgi:hypothetical protein